MLLLHPYHPQTPQQERTFRLILDTQQWLQSHALFSCQVLHAPCWGEGDYEKIVREVWGQPRTLMIWEHDLEAPVHPVARFLGCPEDCCAVDYPIAPGVSVHRHADHRPIAPGDTRATYVGWGLTKFSPRIQALVDWREVAEGTWQNLDSRVGRVLRRRWGVEKMHIHTLGDVRHRKWGEAIPRVEGG